MATAPSGKNLEELKMSTRTSMENKVKSTISKFRRILYSFFS